jgi:hypothetical protein
MSENKTPTLLIELEHDYFSEDEYSPKCKDCNRCTCYDYCLYDKFYMDYENNVILCGDCCELEGKQPKFESICGLGNIFANDNFFEYDNSLIKCVRCKKNFVEKYKYVENYEIQKVKCTELENM